jgi:hypothetical protein
MYKKLFKFSVLLALIISASPAYSHKFRVTNATGEDIAVLVNGALVGSMMQGAYKENGLLPSQKFKKSEFGNTTTIRNAGHLDGPYTIPHNHTVIFDFSNLDFIDCFDLTNIEVGLQSNSFNMVSADIVALPSQWYDSIFDAVKQSAGSMETLGKVLNEKVGSAISDVSTVVSDPKAKVVVGAAGKVTEGAGMVAESLGKLIGSYGNVIKENSCRDMAFIAVKPKENHYVVSLLTKQQ